MPEAPLSAFKLLPMTDYIRGEKNEALIKEMARVLADTPGGRWPFPPIDVRPLPPPEKPAKAKKTNGGPKVDPPRWLVLDGYNRYNAAVLAGRERIPYQVVTARTEGDGFFHQLTANLEHGERLGMDKRDAAIRRLREEFKYAIRIIAKRVHLTPASVSRICAHKQRGQTRARNGRKADTLKLPAPAVFYEQLTQLTQAFSENSENILAARPSVDHDMLANAHAMATALIQG